MHHKVPSLAVIKYRVRKKWPRGPASLSCVHFVSKWVLHGQFQEKQNATLCSIFSHMLVFLNIPHSNYCKVASINTSQLEAHLKFYRLIMKGKFCKYGFDSWGKGGILPLNKMKGKFDVLFTMTCWFSNQ